ncbi:MAG: hypothetical protein PHV99_03920, partial [Candidatus Pacebacteria bacterium]|nr:hypothetical protein [Candidatus Paceibacterota bacterium]
VVTPPPAPVYGCMDPTATNYNASATNQAGITCTYSSSGGGGTPSTPVVGCMDSTATNYNPSATSQTGVTCTYTVTPPPGGGGGSGGNGGNGGGIAIYGTGGGGGGSGMYAPTISLAVLPHINAQPLAYLYLSQIPYTGLDLGPTGTVLYWFALIACALALTYTVLFGAAPFMNRHIRNFGARVRDALNARELAPANIPVTVPAFVPTVSLSEQAPEAPLAYSSYDGFKSYARNGALSIEDIVKGLSRHHGVSQPKPNVEPVYEKVEPIFEQMEAIQKEPDMIVDDIQTREVESAPIHIRGFASAIVEGDRTAVFAGLRQHVRGGGAPEHLLSKTVCLIDDVYRARIDGTACDPELARITARLDMPTLEKLISSLTTAIDASYSTGVTGAKLALTRALAVLGA